MNAKAQRNRAGSHREAKANHYEEKRNKYQVQLDLIESGDVEELDLEVVKEALEYTMMKRR